MKKILFIVILFGSSYSFAESTTGNVHITSIYAVLDSSTPADSSWPNERHFFRIGVDKSFTNPCKPTTNTIYFASDLKADSPEIRTVFYTIALEAYSLHKTVEIEYKGGVGASACHNNGLPDIRGIAIKD